MAKKFLFILFPFVVIVGLFVFGYSRTTPALQNENQPRPQIEITPLVFDFGEISFGAVAKQNFKIKNIGKEILEIKRVATSCSCTTAKVNQEKINPGEEAELSVVYDTAAMGSGSHGKGAQERIIYVKSNDPINPQVEITISAYVR